MVADTCSVILATNNPPIFRWFVHTHLYPFMVKLGWFTINYCFTSIKSSKLQWLQVQMLPPLNKNRGSRWLSWKRSFPGGRAPRDFWKIRSTPQRMQILGPPFQGNGPFSLSVFGVYIIGYWDHPDLNQMNKHLRGWKKNMTYSRCPQPARCSWVFHLLVNKTDGFTLLLIFPMISQFVVVHFYVEKSPFLLE